MTGDLDRFFILMVMSVFTPVHLSARTMACKLISSLALAFLHANEWSVLVCHSV